MLLKYNGHDRHGIKTKITSVTSDERLDVESVIAFSISTKDTHMSLIQAYTYTNTHTHTYTHHILHMQKHIFTGKRVN